MGQMPKRYPQSACEAAAQHLCAELHVMHCRKRLCNLSASNGICLDGEHGAVWTVPFALLASCGRMTSWPSEFQHLLAARTEALVTYTCQNVLVEPSNLIEPLLQGTSNQQLYAEQRFGVQERILIGLRAVLDAAQNTCIADVTQQSTMQMPDAGSHAQLL